MEDAGPTPRKASILSRFLRFRLRTFLLFVFLAACFSAWIGAELFQSRVQRAVVAKIEATTGQVWYDYQGDGWINRHDRTPRGWGPVRYLFGDDFYAEATIVVLNDDQKTEENVALLPRLRGLLELSLCGPGVTDACIDDLLRIGRLRGLYLDHTAISPAGLARLSASATLQHLELWGGSFTHQHLACLPEFSNLETLKIMAASQNDASIEVIGRMHKLRTLSLDGPITDAGFVKLGSLTALENLCLSKTQVGDGAAETIAGFPRLKKLELWGTQISDAGLLELAALQDLNTLDITRTRVTNAGLKHLYRMPSLTRLSVEIDSDITFEEVDALKASMPSVWVDCWEWEPDGSAHTALRP